jgi:hypothetical protein
MLHYTVDLLWNKETDYVVACFLSVCVCMDVVIA